MLAEDIDVATGVFTIILFSIVVPPSDFNVVVSSMDDFTVAINCGLVAESVENNEVVDVTKVAVEDVVLFLTISKTFVPDSLNDTLLVMSATGDFPETDDLKVSFNRLARIKVFSFTGLISTLGSVFVGILVLV